jgi:hypothetical protein
VDGDSENNKSTIIGMISDSNMKDALKELHNKVFGDHPFAIVSHN